MQGSSLERDDRQSVGFEWSKLRMVRLDEVAMRFAFGAVVALVAAIVGTAVGPKIGGLFLAFPAILPASLTLIEKKEGMTKAWADASGGVFGAIGMAAFASTALLLLRWNPWMALLLALLAWAAVSVGLYFLFRVSGLFLLQDRLMSNPKLPARHL